MEASQLRLRRIKDHLFGREDDALGTQINPCAGEADEDPVIALKTRQDALYPYRKDATFDSYKMKRWIEGQEYELKRRIFQTLINDTLFRQPVIELELSRPELRELCFRQLQRVHEYSFVTEEELEKEPWKGLLLSRVLYAYDVSLASKLSLSIGMFSSVLRNLGTERHRKILEKVRTMQVLGAFALTEMSHGTNAKAIQTTATYDKDTKEFVMHSPSFESYKWWIGIVGKTANFAIVLAQLILNGKEYGLHPFVVPIRSLVDHNPFPGVIVGDLGAKLGQNAHENGFIGFDNYRIPREYLLNKIADVTEDGQYTAEHIPPSKRFALLLNPLSAGRVGIVGLCMVNLISAITIGIRFSAARRQFGSEGKEENAVIEYPLQQHRLFPFVAAAYTIEIFRQWLVQIWFTLESQMKTSALDEKLLAEMHAISSAAKPLAGWVARDAIQTVREACGGHGYAASGRLGVLRDDHDPNLTYEGENNVLIQQTGKYLIDQLQKKFSGKPIKSPLGTVDFLNDLEALLERKCPAQQESDFFNPQVYVEALRFRVASLLYQSALKLQNEVSKGGDMFMAWNNCQVFHVHSAAKAYIELLVVEKALERIRTVEDVSLKDVLTQLCHLFSLTRIESDLGNLRENDFLNSEQTKQIRSAILNLCTVLKKDMVSLVDALAPPDAILASSLGNSDGYIYKHLWNATVTSKACFERPTWWPLIKQGTQQGSKAHLWK